MSLQRGEGLQADSIPDADGLVVRPAEQLPSKTASVRTGSACPSNTFRGFRVFMSNARTVESYDPLNRTSPAIASARTASVCP